MTRANLLALVSDRIRRGACIPSAIDGLAEPHTPDLYFHDVPLSDVLPWLADLKAGAPATKQYVRDGKDFDVTVWHGEYFGQEVVVRLYQEAK